MSLFAELKRRKVFRVGAAYLVVAWLAVQAASIVFPAFDAPAWALRASILVALLGFPVVLLLTWVMDLAPEGVRVDPSTSGSGGRVTGKTATVTPSSEAAFQSTYSGLIQDAAGSLSQALAAAGG